MKITFHKTFLKHYQKLPVQTKAKFKSRLVVFEQDEFDPILNNHALVGKYQGYRSINVTGDIRAIFKWEAKNVIFVAIGSHSFLYH